MVTDLFIKEFKENGRDSNTTITHKVLKWIALVIGLAIFVALECYIFFALDTKLNEFSSQYGTYDFLLLFLFILMVAGVLSATMSARKILFKKRDSEVLLPLPIDPDTVVFSKCMYLYCKQVVFAFCTGTPLLICYGMTIGAIPYFYVLTIIYPLLLALFIVGVCLILVFPYNIIYNFVKRIPVLQIIIGLVIVILACFAYQYILNLFVNLITNSRFDDMFSAEFLDALHNNVSYLVPVANLVNAAFINENIGSNMMIFFGFMMVTLILGFIISSLVYKRYLKKNMGSKSTKIIHFKAKIKNKTFMLFKKEFTLLFRDSSYLFSYTSLVILQPFLAFVVISTLSNVLYVSLSAVLRFFPELINGINLLLILLFASVISSSALDVFSREKNGIIVSKYIPISPIKQTLVKTISPMIISTFSLLITLIILISLSEINLSIFFIGLVVGILLTMCLIISGVYIDIRKLSATKTSNIDFLMPLLGVGYPLILFILHTLLMFFYVPNYGIYLSEVGLTLLILLALILPFKRTINKGFIKMGASH